jgi:hypothetical protein
VSAAGAAGAAGAGGSHDAGPSTLRESGLASGLRGSAVRSGAPSDADGGADGAAREVIGGASAVGASSRDDVASPPRRVVLPKLAPAASPACFCSARAMTSRRTRARSSVPGSTIVLPSDAAGALAPNGAASSSVFISAPWGRPVALPVALPVAGSRVSASRSTGTWLAIGVGRLAGGWPVATARSRSKASSDGIGRASVSSSSRTGFGGAAASVAPHWPQKRACSPRGAPQDGHTR